MTFSIKALAKCALVWILIGSHAVAFAEGNPANCSPKLNESDEKVKACQEATDAAKNIPAPTALITSANDNARIQAETAGLHAAATEEASKRCMAVYDNCKEDCAGTQHQRSCEYFKLAAEQHAAASVESLRVQQEALNVQELTNAGGGPGGGAVEEEDGFFDDPMMKALLGAGAGGLLGYLLANEMNKDDDDKDEDDQPKGARLPTGQFDCSKDDAHTYTQCNPWLEANCINNLESANCQRFSTRYCGPVASQATGTSAPSGEGIGTPFCARVNAHNYCKVQGREMCPSCLGLQRAGSPACAQNPSLCLAQNSTDQIAEAKKTCPTDPAFADPTYAAGGGAQVPPQLQTDGVPAVVLPQSVGGGGARPEGAGVREGETSGAFANSGGGGSSYAPASVGGTTRETAAVNRGGYRAAASSTRPAPDVEGPFGPSLFKTSTAVIRNRCDAGKLNNCP